MPRTEYRNAAGKRLPGVTTILDDLGWNKRTLIRWAASKGADHDGARDGAMSLGTLVHDFIERDLRAQPIIRGDEPSESLDVALHCFRLYQRWRQPLRIEVIALEEPLISERFQVGGTPDLYAKVDGVRTLLDWKTSKPYPEHLIQLAAYGLMLAEKYGEPPERYTLLSLPKDGDSWTAHTYDELDDAAEVFKHLIAIHTLKPAVQVEVRA